VIHNRGGAFWEFAAVCNTVFGALRHTSLPDLEAGFPKSKETEMTHLKLQAALDELERLCDTVKGFKERNGGTLPNPDSDAGRALSALETFTSELHKFNIGKVLGHKV
jgi:hypothetical protein